MIFRRSATAKAAELDRAEDETTCLFVSSKGLMKLCETHQPLPNDFAEKWPPRALRHHKPGGRIYVHATALADFARRALPRIRQDFVLVMGDSVADVSPGSLGAQTVQAVLDSPHLLAWHAQNLAFDHPAVSPMPLGMDYHTIARRRRPEWGPGASPRAQEDVLHVIRQMSPPLEERQPLGYSNWHFVPGNGDRAEVLKTLPADATHYEPERVARTESWRRNAGFAFTISPRGRGMDCHRTWEAILLGAAPVIPDLPINRLFETLPVVIVQYWSQVTLGFLAQERERILDESFDFAPVLLEYWRRKLHGRSDLPRLKMRYQTFMKLGAAALREAAGL